MPGPTSKASRELAHVRSQLKTGKTRNGRPLEPEEIAALEGKRDRIISEMRAARQKKLIAKITEHTTFEADRVIGEVREVPQAVQQRIAEELDRRLGPAPVGAMGEALAERARTNKRIRELRKLERLGQQQPVSRRIPNARAGLRTPHRSRWRRDRMTINTRPRQRL